MKLIVLEGPDNTGKSTLAGVLANHFKANKENVMNIHFRAPAGINPDDCRKRIYGFDIHTAKQLRKIEKAGNVDVVILDRSWYSEYVYGQLYRERTAEDILSHDIRDTEDIVINSIQDTYLVLCQAENPDALVKHEDGKSLSKANPDLLKTEIRLFNEVFDNAGLAYAVKVNVFDNDNKFRDPKTILHEVLNFIYSEK